MSNLIERYSDSLMNTFGRPRLALTRGAGSRVWDEAGKEYVDLFGGIAVTALGHAHPALIEAVNEQMLTLGHISNFFTSPQQVALAERLIDTLKLDEDTTARVFFSNSGTEANEAALKATRRTGRTHLVAMEGSFHGRTLGALALTSKAAYREPFEPLPGEVTWVPYGDAEALSSAVTECTAAVVIEPLQGEGGVIVPPEDFLAEARRITEANGALLWLDEVQTGVGRTGSWWAHGPSGVVPDLLTSAKGLGGGVPIGATIGIGAAAGLLEPGNHGTTFGGNPVACAAALAVLETIEREGLLDAAVVRGRELTEILEGSDLVTSVEGTGLLLGAQLAEPIAAEVVALSQEAGFLLNNTGPSRLRFAPALNIGDADLDAFADVWPRLATAAGQPADASEGKS